MARETFCEFCGELLGIPEGLTGDICACPGSQGLRGVPAPPGSPQTSLPPGVDWDIQGRIRLPAELLVTMVEDPDERGFYMWDLEGEC